MLGLDTSSADALRHYDSLPEPVPYASWRPYKRALCQYIDQRKFAVAARVLREDLPNYAQRSLEAVIGGGDADAVLSLVVAAPNELRGWVAVLLYYHPTISQDAYREGLRNVWIHDHHVLVAGTERRMLRQMFRIARFDVPQTFSGCVTVWRGARLRQGTRSLRKAARGLSWTTDRDRAGWFAVRDASEEWRPVVLQATVRRQDILMFCNQRHEAEVVAFDLRDVRVSGSLEEWELSCQRRAAADRARDLAEPWAAKLAVA